MAYDFDTLVPAFGVDAPMRRHLNEGGFSEDVIDYGIAEMKFRLLPEMKSAMKELIDGNIIGYSAANSEYLDAVCSWQKRRHNWDIKPEYIVQTYGVVVAIGIAIRAFTEKGDNILIQSPVYTPFSVQVESNGRHVLESTLIYKNGTYEIDFDDFEKKAKDAKMFILCSPHNPVGRVWTKEELSKMAEICLKNNVFMLSDEIHNDLVYGREHTVFAKVSETVADKCIVCTAPSKTFNIPGLITSNIIIKNEDIRSKFNEELFRTINHFSNPLGTRACTAAYTHGDKWVDELCAYIAENAKTLEKELSEKIPEASMAKMEGTYLAWVDLSFLGLADDELKEFMEKKAGLPVNMGSAYGKTGAGFIRVNIGCPKKYVIDFVDRLAKAISKR